MNRTQSCNHFFITFFERGCIISIRLPLQPVTFKTRSHTSTYGNSIEEGLVGLCQAKN
jgi:hypothetical protein